MEDIMSTLEESKLWLEIHQQPEAIRNSLKINRPILREIASEVRKRQITNVVLVGRGSSDHANLVARFLFEIHTPMIVSIGAPSIITAYHGKVDYAKVLMVGVSQSGGARDVYEMMDACAKQGGLVVSITNVRGSLMTTTGSYALNNECGAETSITAAKSYMTQIALLSALVAEISGDETLLAEVDHIADTVEEALTLRDQVEAIIPTFRDVSKIMLFGRGLLSALSMETELKIQETCYLDARAYASSDYRHGPIASTELFIPAIFFIADRQTDYCPLDLHARLKREYQILDCVVTNKPESVPDAKLTIILPRDFDGLRAVYACAVVSQMFACLLSIARGYDPDNPVGVSKNTVTI
jgi:glutamine---fructose-6-phosphate transaminase (isomerizing)